MATKQRPYDASDLKELMDNTGGWAHSWDDVLRYLEGPAVYDADFAKDEVPALIDDIRGLKQKGEDFTTDYRTIWHDITGESTQGMPPPEGVKKPPTNPIELEDRYLKGLDFPASKGDVLQQAKDNDAPDRVTNTLAKIDDKQYKDMNHLLESVGDVAWDHD